MNLTEVYSNIKNTNIHLPRDTTNVYNLTAVDIVQMPDKKLSMPKNTTVHNNRSKINTNANGVLQDKKGKNTTPSKYDVYKNS